MCNIEKEETKLLSLFFLRSFTFQHQYLIINRNNYFMQCTITQPEEMHHH